MSRWAEAIAPITIIIIFVPVAKFYLYIHSKNTTNVSSNHNHKPNFLIRNCIQKYLKLKLYYNTTTTTILEGLSMVCFFAYGP